MSFIYLLAALQALFLAALLLAKKTRSTADRVLMVWLLGIGVHTGIYFLRLQFDASLPVLLTLNAGFPFLQGPFLLAYVAALVGFRERFRPPDYLHLAPFTAFLLYVLWAFGSGSFAVSGGAHAVSVSLFSLAWVVTALLLLTIPVYIAWSLALMRRAARVLSGPKLPATFRWLRLFLAGLGVIWLATVLNFALSRFTGIAPPTHLAFWALTLFVYGLGYLGLTRTSIFLEPQMEALRQELQPKYGKSGLGPVEAGLLHGELTAYVERQRPYLDPELSLQSLAEQLGLSTNHLSQVINECEGQSFRDYINRRRVEESCRRLASGEAGGLLELAMDCGFNSKSSFNRAFKKFTGRTPSQYQEAVRAR